MGSVNCSVGVGGRKHTSAQRITPGFRSGRDVIKERTCRVLLKQGQSYIGRELLKRKNTPPCPAWPLPGKGSAPPVPIIYMDVPVSPSLLQCAAEAGVPQTSKVSHSF